MAGTLHGRSHRTMPGTRARTVEVTLGRVRQSSRTDAERGNEVVPEPGPHARMEDLEDRFNKWEQLGRELGAGGSDFAVPEITKSIALTLLVPDEIEQQFISAPEGSLKTYQQQIAYVRQRITDHKARNMSAKTFKQANTINEVGAEQPGGWLLYTFPSPRDRQKSRMPPSA